jgi:hypothetical protein
MIVNKNYKVRLLDIVVTDAERERLRQVSGDVYTQILSIGPKIDSDTFCAVPGTTRCVMLIEEKHADKFLATIRGEVA